MCVREGGRRSICTLLGGRPDVDFEVRLPRAAAVRLDAMAGDATLRGLRGEQDLHVVSGDLELHDAGGRIGVSTVSGDVAIRGDRLWLVITTTSGDVAVDAELVERLAARSVSGDVIVRAALGRDTGHTFESVSGDLHLSTGSGLTVEVSGVSGSVRSDLPTRREKLDGRRLTLVGDGAVSVRVRTVSGDVHVDAPRTGPGRAAGRLDGRSDPGTAWPPDPSMPPAAPSPPPPPMAPPSGAVEDTALSPVAGGDARTPTSQEADQLSILRQLEAGEIDVEEAARQLEALT